MKTGYIVIDIGTGNTRAALFTDEGECVAVNTVDTEYIRDLDYDDAYSFDPEKMFKNIITVTKKCIHQAKEIRVKGITSTSQRQGIVLIDKEGNSFLGLPNIDNRGKEYEEDIPDNELIYELTGRWSKAYFSAYKLYGLRQKKEKLSKRIWKILSISDWVGYMFTGNLRYEPSQACETLLFDTKHNCFSETLCDMFDIDINILPQVGQCGECLGEVKQDLSDELNISKDTPFIIGGADTQFALKGVAAKKGDLVITAGTTTPIAYITDDYFVDEKQRCWVNRHVDKDLFVVETNVGVTGLSYQNLKPIFFPNKSYDEIGSEIDVVMPPKCMASLATMEFSKSMEINWGGFVFKTPVIDLRASDFAYAALFNMACGVKENVDTIETIMGIENDTVIACGGGCNGDIFPQLVANLLKKTVILYEGYDQASALGGVRIINESFGKVESHKKVYKKYSPQENNWNEKYYEEWKTLKHKLNS